MIQAILKFDSLASTVKYFERSHSALRRSDIAHDAFTNGRITFFKDLQGLEAFNKKNPGVTATICLH